MMAVKGFLTAIYLWLVLSTVTNGQFYPNIQPNSFLPQSQPIGSPAFQPSGRQNAFTPEAQSTGFNTNPHGMNPGSIQNVPGTSPVHPGSLNIPQLVSSLLSPGSGFIPLNLNGPTNLASQNPVSHDHSIIPQRPDSSFFNPQQTRPFGFNNQNPGSTVTDPQPKPFSHPQLNNPFSPPLTNPFNPLQGPPFISQQSNPLNSQQSNPFPQQSNLFNPQRNSRFMPPQTDHFPPQQINPPISQQTNPFISHQPSPFNSQPVNPFTTQPTNPFNLHQTNPFSLQQNRPFISPQINPFNQNQNRPINSPLTNPFNPNQNRPFNSLQTHPFSQNQNRPFNSPFSNPFNPNQNRPLNFPFTNTFNPNQNRPLNSPFTNPFNPNQNRPLNSPFTNAFNPNQNRPFNPSQINPLNSQSTNPSFIGPEKAIPSFSNPQENNPLHSINTSNLKKQPNDPNVSDSTKSSPTNINSQGTIPNSSNFQPNNPSSTIPQNTNPDSIISQQTDLGSINPQITKPESTSPQQIKPDSANSQQPNLNPILINPDSESSKRTDSDLTTLKKTDSDSEIPPNTDSDYVGLPQTDPISTESLQTDSDSTEPPQTDSDSANTQQTSSDSTNSQQTDSDSSNPQQPDLLRDLQKIFIIPDDTEPISSASDTSSSVSNVSQDISSLTTLPQQTTDIPDIEIPHHKHVKPFHPEPTDDPLKGRRIVCLFNNKHFYKNGFNPAKLEPHLCTHLNYEFAILDPKSYEMIIGDPDLDIGMNFYQEFLDLKKLNPKLKIIISLGGWADSTKKYSELAADPEKRLNFVKKAVEFVQKHGFDGIDLAWEYPNCWQGAIGVSPKDKGNFVILLKELNAELKKYGFILSVSVGAIKREVEAAYDVPEVSKNVDYINVMTYDMHGPWEPKTSHHVQFEAMPDDTDPYCNVKGGMQVWIEKGASKQKLNMGYASYGRTFELANPNQCGMGVPAKGPGRAFPPDNEGGRLSYNGICQLLNSGDWIEKEDKHAGFYACSGNQWAGYDPPMMIVKKSKYVIESGIYGILFKDLSGDDFEGKCSGMSFPLLKMARMEMIHRINKHPHPRKHP